MAYSNYRVRRQARAPDRTRAPAGGGRILGGAWSGAIAGLVMLGAAMVSGWALGEHPLTPLRAVACALYGVDGLVCGQAGILAGLGVHLAVSAAWGILFAAILHHLFDLLRAGN